MIVPMKKLFLLCLDKDHVAVMRALRKLGVAHIVPTQKPESAALSFRERVLGDVKNVINTLKSYTPNSRKTVPASEYTAEELMALSLNEIDHAEALKIKLDNINKDIESLTPWGDFNPDDLQALKRAGVYAYLCASTPDQMAQLPENVYVQMIERRKNMCFYAVVSLDELPPQSLPLAPLPEHISLTQARRMKDETSEHLQMVQQHLKMYSHQLKKLEPLQKQYQQNVTFESALASMGKEGKLCILQGYIPAEDQARVSDFARDNGCAAVFEEPEPDEPVPTLLRIPKFARCVKPLFDFIGILPGYREWDVAVCFLFFFSVFFAMIVNDGGYALIFLLIGIVMCLIGRKKGPTFMGVAQLWTVLSSFALIWGVINGAYFGMTQATLDSIGLGALGRVGLLMEFHMPWIPGIDALNSKGEMIYSGDALRQLNTEYICFAIALTHLSIARFWKFCYFFKKKQVLTAFSQLGWILFLIGNFFLAVQFVVFPDSMPSWVTYCYLVGFALIALGVKWRDVGDVFNVPFSLINSFVDTLSYIRLYAVGLAGMYIAQKFNEIGASISIADGHVNSWILLPATIVIIFAGHILNVALVMMSVMVHAIRLNTLEFSNHMGLEWTGHAYEPFKDTLSTSNQTNHPLEQGETK